MPFIIPDSEVILYSNVKITDGEQIAFPSLSSQTSYFTNHIVTRVQNCSYIRKSRSLRLEVPSATVANCNYVSFKNTSFENKTIYARIVNWEYVNNVTTDIQYTIDWFQTYCFDVEYENAFIKREHLSSADYVKAQTNPFDPSIYEFQTAEQLPVGHTLEDLPSVGSTASIVGQTADNSNIAIVMFISDFNTEAISQDYADFLTIFAPPNGYVVKPDGTTVPDTLSPPHRIPRAYGIYCLNAGQNQLEKFADALDWLSVHDLTHQVIGVYALPQSYVTNYMISGQFSLNKSLTPLGYNIVNRKLYLSPFQYIRVYNNEGDIKEYHYEDFATIRTGGMSKSGILYFVMTLDGLPAISLIPQQYNITISNTENGLQELNVNERIDVVNIMQLGYSSDAFLAYLSSQYAKTVGNRTTYDEDYDAKRIVSNIADASLDAVSSGAKFATLDVEGGVAGANRSFAKFNEIEHDINKNYREPSLIEQARSTGASNQEINSVFGNAKRVHVANEYHAGSSSGALPFYAGFALNPNWFLVVQVKLKDSILQTYDRFFSMYGYASNRIAIPKVCNFIKGSSDANAIPHFDTEIESAGMTYCSTANMHVISPLSVVSDYIESLFNSGCRFHRGDRLT